MPKSNPEGTFCQSCGMPLRKPEDFGTEAGGAGSTEYCCHCFRNGTFTEPAIDMQGMIEKCVRIMTEQGIMAEPEQCFPVSGVKSQSMGVRRFGRAIPRLLPRGSTTR